MRSAHLTLGLGFVAGVAVLVAPRLQGLGEPTAVDLAAPQSTTECAQEVSLSEPQDVSSTGVGMAGVRPRDLQPAPPPPAPEVLPMKTGESPTVLIPELDGPRPVLARPVPRPSVPIDVRTWDDCLGCGMG